MTTPNDDWPAAVEVLNAAGRAPVVLLCEHASNFIPPEYRQLGLSAAELQRHIAWDIGAAGVARQLSRMLDAPAFLGTYSRLLIDLNRPLRAGSSIVTRSEATDVPGNDGIAPEERENRVKRIFAPYHGAIEEHLARRAEAAHPTVMVAIHSFTPTFHGVPRKWHAGVLFDKAAAFADATMARLVKRDPHLVVGGNVPYAVSVEEDYGLLVYGDNVGNPSILIEIRQDLLDSPEHQLAWAQRLADTLAIDVALGRQAPANT